MVWFQCESCGDNLKKPKLQSHFQQCAARKLSCIDCGVVFDRQSVQGHTSCVTEEVRYGPRDAFRQALANPSAGSKENPAKGGENLELTIGLSTRPPWECTLCRVKCTSEETLQGHAQGKKHRAKARAAAKAQAEKEVPTEGVVGAASTGENKGGKSENGDEHDGAVTGTAAKGGVAEAEGKASMGGNSQADGKGSGEKKRRKGDVGADDLQHEVTAEVGKKRKKGKQQKEDIPGVMQEAEKETVAEAGDADGQARLKKETKKGKKRKGEEVMSLNEGVEEEAPEKVKESGLAEESNTHPAVVKDSSTVAKKKSKKEKKGAGSSDAASKPPENGSLEHVTADKETSSVQNGQNDKQNGKSEAKAKNGKAGKVLDEKQYWEELAEKGRKKKQADSPAVGDREGPETHGANEMQGEPSNGVDEPPRKESKKRRGEKIATDVDEGGKSARKKGKKEREVDGGVGTLSGGAIGASETTVKKIKRAANESAVASTVDAGDAAAAAIKPGKLRKMMQAALQEADKHTLSLKSLLQSVQSQATLAIEVSTKALQEQILVQATKNSKFQLTGKKVSLRTDT
ncbi:hypothetical protein KFL_003590150 [Klebsormidium nitens]|uniref:C2H2-type domain-containing protein n=1 Tax=Klebsormidium nitens TaxID=105231 RepID=A0A1Y1IEN0_KLENI|nr:hypothetical protein KFL_003590150 [Klebsormidium nitens]|eukprot:GAQ87541.1 hypothetical protein KFL_003590150 [Klebsormidium nitens]